jgi:hypothetical protein
MEKDSKREKKERVKSKAYVKPSVVKHTAASLVVGSACNQYSSSYVGGSCSGGVGYQTYYH